MSKQQVRRALSRRVTCFPHRAGIIFVIAIIHVCVIVNRVHTAEGVADDADDNEWHAKHNQGEPHGLTVDALKCDTRQHI